ncbi:hypothetical protein Taro_050980 [Colocasia esculenta]|uniref:Uncharacterized protein n=1 Tax=Colocasia esculenta TaxID=4460 RepID=A0A843XFR9_COLES|nr:hypothetical protein [Colocasia esculenta]
MIQTVCSGSVSSSQPRILAPETPPPRHSNPSSPVLPPALPEPVVPSDTPHPPTWIFKHKQRFKFKITDATVSVTQVEWIMVTGWGATLCRVGVMCHLGYVVI